MSRFGLPAIFLLTMVEGDITLLLAGVLAHGQAFGDYSFAQVLVVGTLGGVASDQLAYALGRGARNGVRKYRFYRAARSRIERLTEKFGGSRFSSRSTLRAALGRVRLLRRGEDPSCASSCSRSPSCFMWVLTLATRATSFTAPSTTDRRLHNSDHPATLVRSASRPSTSSSATGSREGLRGRRRSDPEVRAGRRRQAARDQGRDSGDTPARARAPQGAREAEAED